MTTDFNGRMPAAGVQPPAAVAVGLAPDEQGTEAKGTHKAASSRPPSPPGLHRVDGRCVATTLAGKPCPVRPLAGKPYCRMHFVKLNPQSADAERVQLQRRLGGLTATTKRLPADFPTTDYRTPEGVRLLLERVTDAVLRGDVAPSQANSVASLAATALQLGELQVETQLAELELRMKEGKR